MSASRSFNNSQPNTTKIQIKATEGRKIKRESFPIIRCKPQIWKEKAEIIPRIRIETTDVERKSRNHSQNLDRGRRCGKKKPESFPESRKRPHMWKEKAGIIPRNQKEAADMERKSWNHSRNPDVSHRCGKNNPESFQKIRWRPQKCAGVVYLVSIK